MTRLAIVRRVGNGFELHFQGDIRNLGEPQRLDQAFATVQAAKDATRASFAWRVPTEAERADLGADAVEIAEIDGARSI